MLRLKENVQQDKVIQSAYKNKNNLKRIEWRMVMRLIKVMYYDQGMKKTTVAMKCNMSYDRCVCYIGWMEMMDLIKREFHDGFELLSLDTKGREIYQKQLDLE